MIRKSSPYDLIEGIFFIMNKICGIYKITSPTGKIYIGQSVDIFKRFEAYDRIDCEKQPKIYNSLKKYGVENHVFEILEICSRLELNEKEKFYISKYNSFDTLFGLNLTSGGNSKQIVSMETRKKLSLAKIGNKYGEGKHCSDEKRKKISLANKGKTKNIGRIWGNETIEKMSKSNIGRKQNKITSSKYVGVSIIRGTNSIKYRVRVRVNHKPVHVGYFYSEAEAAKAYDSKMIELYGNSVPLNFPNTVEKKKLIALKSKEKISQDFVNLTK